MEQFPIREMVPLMMDDSKPSIWPVSNQNLTNNDEILDYLSPKIYSKGAALLRLVEYIVSVEAFQTAVTNILSISDTSNVLNSFYSNLNFNTTLNTTVTIEEFVRSWVEERNYPVVTIHLISGDDNDTMKNTTLVFRQTRYLGSPFLDDSSLDLNYRWKIYMECQLGGLYDGDLWNLTTNLAPSPLKFIFESSTETIVLPDVNYLWIKCNKDFYSYQVTDYVSYGENQHVLWQFFQLIFNEVCDKFFLFENSS
jgi:aminopeptidase N